MMQDMAIVTTEYASFQMIPYLMTLNNPNPNFKVTPLFDAKYIRKGTRYRHSYNEMLTGTNRTDLE